MADSKREFAECKGEPTESKGESAESVELQKKLIEVIGELVGKQGSYAEMRGKISTAGFDCEFFCRTCQKMAAKKCLARISERCTKQ